MWNAPNRYLDRKARWTSRYPEKLGHRVHSRSNRQEMLRDRLGVPLAFESDAFAQRDDQALIRSPKLGSDYSLDNTSQHDVFQLVKVGEIENDDDRSEERRVGKECRSR